MIALARRDGRLVRIGHRGAAALAPENTLASFREAVEIGVDLVEFDVVRLADGTPVVAHSFDLHEVSHGAARGTLRGRTLAQLREAAPAVPTLAEALSYFATEASGVGVHLDLKHRSASRQVAAELVRLGLAERCLVSSFYWRSLRTVRRGAPGVRTGVSFPRDPLRAHERRDGGRIIRGVLFALRLVLPAFVGPLLAVSGATALVLHHRVVSSSVVRRAHARGAVVIAWTVDDPVDLARVDEAGVDAVVSNDPRIFLSTLPS